MMVKIWFKYSETMDRKVEFSQELQQAGIDLFTNPDNIKDKDKRYPVK